MSTKLTAETKAIWHAYLLSNPVWQTPLALVFHRCGAYSHQYMRWALFEKSIRKMEHSLMVSERLEEHADKRADRIRLFKAMDIGPHGDDPGSDPVFAAAHCRDVSPAYGSGDGRVKYKAFF